MELDRVAIVKGLQSVMGTASGWDDSADFCGSVPLLEKSDGISNIEMNDGLANFRNGGIWVLKLDEVTHWCAIEAPLSVIFVRLSGPNITQYTPGVIRGGVASNCED